MLVCVCCPIEWSSSYHSLAWTRSTKALLFSLPPTTHVFSHPEPYLVDDRIFNLSSVPNKNFWGVRTEDHHKVNTIRRWLNWIFDVILMDTLGSGWWWQTFVLFQVSTLSSNQGICSASSKEKDTHHLRFETYISSAERYSTSTLL